MPGSKQKRYFTYLICRKQLHLCFKYSSHRLYHIRQYKNETNYLKEYYRSSDHWRGLRGLKTKDIIKNGNFDIVVIQEQSMGTVQYPDSFRIYSKKLCDYIKRYGAKPYFYSTWARKEMPQLQETISKVYSQAALENGAGIIHVGEAWAQAQKLRPEIELYMSDGSHPSPLGAFLTACVFLGIFSKEFPDQIPTWGFTVLDARGEEILLMIQDPIDISFCLKVAEAITRK